MLKRFNSDFIKSIVTLVTGTMIAQVVTYLLSPVLTRVYTPEDMSYLSLYSRIVAFFAVVATARFELAFPLPKRDEHAFSLYKISIYFTIITTLISLVAVLIIGLIDWKNPTVKGILYFIPLGILFTAFHAQGLNWSIRTKQFKIISLSKILQSTFNSIVPVLLSFFSLGYKGLIFGYIASVVASASLYLKDFYKTFKTMKPFKLKGRNYAIARYYSDFPRINLPHVLMDFSKELFIAFFLINSFEKEVLGLYDFSFRMLKLPIGLVGASIGQVFFKKAADLINENKSIFELVRKTLLTLFLLSILPFGLLLFFGDDIFAFVFGEPWREAGVYSQIMSLWLMSNFLISPISQIPIILNRQKGFFIISIIGTLSIILSLMSGYLFPSYNLSFKEILKIVSITQLAYHIFAIIWILKISKQKINQY